METPLANRLSSKKVRHIELATGSGPVVVVPTLHQRLSTLHEISIRLGDAVSFDRILEIMRSETRWLIEHQACFMALINRTRTHYVVHSLSSVTDAADLHQKHFFTDEGVAGAVMSSRTATRTDTRSAENSGPAIEGRLLDLGIKSLLAVPMHAGAETTGCLIFGRAHSAAYSLEDAGIAQQFADHCSMLIRNCSIIEDAGKRISQIELINEVSHQLSAMLHVDELLRGAAESIRETFHYFDVTVFLLNEDRTELLLEAHSGNFSDFLPHGYRQKVGHGIVGWVAENDEEILCNDVSADPRYIVHEYHNTKSELALPIRVDGQLAGVLNVEDAKLHAFDETDGVVLETLCDQLGSALKNARLYEEIQEANIRLIELDKVKTEFLGIVSHDFRSPLSSIILAGRALLKNEEVRRIQRVKDYLQIIVDQANKLNQLAEDTLSITKMESGELTYHFKVVNVIRLIQDAISMVRMSSRHTIAFEVDPTVTFIKADPAKLRQVVQNLIGNAVKYSPRGGKISVKASDYSPKEMLLSVSDQGIGIPAEKVDLLFQKYARVDSGEGNQIKGAGLGLWICKAVVEAHGGNIWIESGASKGTTIKFTVKKVQ